MFGTSQAVSAARQLLALRKDYSNPPKGERELDPLFYAYLKGHHTKARVSRQAHVRFANRKKPSRIDYRVGGPNPTLLELAVRPPNGIQELMGPQNLKELRKLSKFPQTKAKRRILLLLDLKGTPILKSRLKASYDTLNAGPGRKNRNAVTVVYVHANTDYAFSWSPFK
jgi:hypothetical protein